MSGPVRVKICGVMDSPTARACAELGAWAVGVVLAAGSPRTLGVGQAARVLDALPEGVARVGVFVDLDAFDAPRIAAAAGLTHLQVHGNADPARLTDATGLPVIQGFRVDGPAALDAARASAAQLVLLDAAVPDRHGGTGTAFDHRLLRDHPLGRPFALAGGLTPGNVGAAVAELSPDIVDVSSGVESAPGRKDLALIREFIDAARRAGRAAA